MSAPNSRFASLESLSAVVCSVAACVSLAAPNCAAFESASCLCSCPWGSCGKCLLCILETTLTIKKGSDKLVLCPCPILFLIVMSLNLLLVNSLRNSVRARLCKQPLFVSV